VRNELTLPERAGSGLLGAATLTLVNEIGHRLMSESPRLDVLGMRALVRGYRAADEAPPRGPAIPLMALAGDLLANTVLYGLMVRRRSVARGALLGAAAGAAAAIVGRFLGMNRRTGYHWGRELAMVGFHGAAGVAAALATF
jgi:hypothetical protein